MVYQITCLWRYSQRIDLSFWLAINNQNIRDLKPSNRLAMRTYLQEVNTLVCNAHGCAEKVSTFQSIIQHGLDSVPPLWSKTIHSRDPSWINPALKNLIKRRQRAVAENNQPMFWFLRNRVNRENKFCRQRYYHRGPTQSVWVADCYFIVNVLDIPFASPIAIYR